MSRAVLSLGLAVQIAVSPLQAQSETPERPFGTLREQAQVQQAWLQERLETVLPQLMREQGVEVHLSEEAREWLAEKGYDPAFGARPLRRTLQRLVESPLSNKLIRSEFKPGDKLRIEVEKDKLVFRKLDDKQPVPVPA